MKRIFFLLLFALNLSCGYVIAQTVYITDTGEKYHTSGCRYLKHSKSAIALKDALATGYEACKVCRPSQSVEEQLPNKKEKVHTPSQKSSSSFQCGATTKAGNRCKRSAASANGMCWQHGG